MPFLRLVTGKGRIVTDSMEVVEAPRLQDGDQVAVIAGQPKLAATEACFLHDLNISR